ncbi:MAG: hypothetical protein FWF75_06355 [Propionibacteriaceae bacterium]|nr:hypothetical protein [Propionibacteriaceae bacterium]
MLTSGCAALLIAGLGLTGCAQKPPAAGFTEATFTSMTAPVTVSFVQNGTTGSTTDQIQIAPGIQHAINTDWSDHGTAAGQALVHAACPQTGQNPTPSQATVATQLLIYAASQRQTNHAWTPQPGIASAIAQTIACHIDDLYADAPHTDTLDPTKIDWPQTPITGQATTHLGVNATVLGTTIQAIATNPADITTITTAWSNHLPDYLNSHIPTEQQAMVTFYFQTVQTTQTHLALEATDSLIFVTANAMAGVSDDTSDAPMHAIMAAGSTAADTIYPTFVKSLSHNGYFAPDIIAQANQRYKVDIPDPTKPLPAADSTKVLSAPLTMTASGWTFDNTSTSGAQWLSDSHISGIALALPTAQVSDPSDTRFVVPLP